MSVATKLGISNKMLGHFPGIYTETPPPSGSRGRRPWLLHRKRQLKRTFFGQASAFARPGLAVVGVDFALRTVWVSSGRVSRLGEGLAGGVAGGGLAQAALGFGLEARLVERFLLRRPVTVHLRLVQHVLVAAVGTLGLCQVVFEGEHPCRELERSMDGV